MQSGHRHSRRGGGRLGALNCFRALSRLLQFHPQERLLPVVIDDRVCWLLLAPSSQAVQCARCAPSLICGSTLPRSMLPVGTRCHMRRTPLPCSMPPNAAVGRGRAAAAAVRLGGVQAAVCARAGAGPQAAGGYCCNVCACYNTVGCCQPAVCAGSRAGAHSCCLVFARACSRFAGPCNAHCALTRPCVCFCGHSLRWS